MAGGWGYSVQQPMEVPQEPPLRYMDDDMPEVQSPAELPLPDSANTDISLLRRLNKALPEKPGGEIQQRGRMEDAAEYAAAMGQAYAITKQYNKIYAARARAKGRATERISKRVGKTGSGLPRSNQNRAVEKNTAWRNASMTYPDARQFLTYYR